MNESKLDKVEVDGQVLHILWEVFDENGNFVEEAMSEDHANDIIQDANKDGIWYMNDRLVE